LDRIELDKESIERVANGITCKQSDVAVAVH